MKISRKKISKLSDDELLSLWRETGRGEYEGVLLLRYLPFIHGVYLDATGDAVRARESVRGSVGRFGTFLVGYDCGDNFSAWLYRALIPGNHKNGRLTPAQKNYVRRLAAADQGAVAAFGEAAPGLTKPQRECIRRFFFEGAAFETIAEQTGYLTDGIRAHIEAGVAKIVKENDGKDDSAGNVARFREALVAYIKGERDDADAQAVEMESMLDPFLSDAIEGYIHVSGDHARAVAELDHEVEAAYFRPRRGRWWIWALVGLAVVVVGAYLYLTPAMMTDLPDKMPPLSTHTVVMKNEGTEKSHPVAVEPPATGEYSGVIETADMATVAEQEDSAVMLVSISQVADAADATSQYVSLPKIGLRGYNEYLKKAAIDLGEDVAGDVKITFHVNRYGRPSTIRVVEYLTPEAHREAIRLLDIGPEWSPTEELVTVVMRFGVK